MLYSLAHQKDIYFFNFLVERRSTFSVYVGLSCFLYD